ncbi:MAG: CBS domain-containing protein, partial [Paracoccaceae bacterium]
MNEDKSPPEGAESGVGDAAADRAAGADATRDPSAAEAPEEDTGRRGGFLARLWGRSNGASDEEPHDAAQTANERALLSNIRTMRDQRVDDIMIPRADIVAVEASATLAELTEAFRSGAHSRLPVYRETLDDPIGFIHVKDVALARGFGVEPGAASA